MKRGKTLSTFYNSLLDLVSEVTLKSFGSAWVSILFLVMSCEFSDSHHSGNPIKQRVKKMCSVLFARISTVNAKTCAYI